MSAVQLAYPADALPSDQDCDPYLDKIGGKPVWLDMKTEPPQHLAKCQNCGRAMYLVAQVYAAVPDGRKDRLIYIWGCNSRPCMASGKGWLALRAIRSSKKVAKASPASKAKDPSPQSQASVKTYACATKKDKSGSATTKTSTATPVKAKSSPTSMSQSPFQPVLFGSGETWDEDIPVQFGGLKDKFGVDDVESVVTGVRKLQVGDVESDTTRKGGVSDIDEIELLLASREKNSGASPFKASPSAKKKKKNAAKPQEVAKEHETEQAINESVVEPAEVTASQEALKQPDTPDLTVENESWSTAQTFPAVYLEFDNEDDSGAAVDTYEHEMQLLEQYRRSGNRVDLENPQYDGDGEEGNGTWADEGYEKIRPKFYDKAFKNFQKAVKKSPEQCLRYSLNGKPVFYSTDHVHHSLTTSGPPPCANCGGHRVFELQLMPAILSILPSEQFAARTKREEDKQRVAAAAADSAISPQNAEEGPQRPATSQLTQQDLAMFLSEMSLGMDFGTVLIYTCERDCDVSAGVDVGVAYIQEFAAIQLERWN
ncbi:programmed cell death protein [Phlyctochytrium planicorne]|nr:programmed cell death protein [Phlyctochytrium planicorne]